MDERCSICPPARGRGLCPHLPGFRAPKARHAGWEADGAFWACERLLTGDRRPGTQAACRAWQADGAQAVSSQEQEGRTLLLRGEALPVMS